MRRRIRGVNEWVEHRTGIQSAVRQFLYEEIPASSGWHQVFGSVAMFLFMVQAFTGALLAFNYAATPGDAYNSLRYILTELTGGRLMRGLHHWGGSMIIVVVVLHMVQVFLYGAYKKPREATWMVGVVLLLVTLAYGLTGYLLPWDNRAYWGTVVTTQIAAKAPVVGPYLSRLLGGEGAVGVVTFARFYGLHVLLLPPATFFLMVLHVYLVRKHGVAPVPGDELKPKKKFYPQQVFKDTMAIFIAFAILFMMAVAVRVPLEQLADPTDTSYIPRPEWYFLFLFQTLKLFDGPLEVIGSVVLPGLAVLLLILVPFIDRSRHGESHAAHGGAGVRAAGRDRLGRADRRRGEIHAEGSAGSGGGLFGPHRLDAAVARGNGGYRIFPSGELRELPCHRGPGYGSRAGPHQGLDPQRCGVDDPAF